MSEYERACVLISDIACVLSTSTIERCEMSSRKRPKSDMPSLDDLLAQGSRARESLATTSQELETKEQFQSLVDSVDTFLFDCDGRSTALVQMLCL